MWSYIAAGLKMKVIFTQKIALWDQIKQSYNQGSGLKIEGCKRGTTVLFFFNLFVIRTIPFCAATIDLLYKTTFSFPVDVLKQRALYSYCIRIQLSVIICSCSIACLSRSASFLQLKMEDKPSMTQR